MSYGVVYIQSDIAEMRKKGYSDMKIIRAITSNLRSRYPDMQRVKAKRIAYKVLNKIPTTVEDWSR